MDDDGDTITQQISRIEDRLAPTDAYLVVLHGGELGLRYPLATPDTLIGRSPDADIQLDQVPVSRRHTRISQVGDRYLLTDLESTNGTLVNDEQTDKRELRNGDLIKIGHTIFKFLCGQEIEAHYHEAIRRLTTIDGLTDVYNRRYFDECIVSERSRALRHKRDLSLVLIDLDRLKEANDNLGHLAGDYVLRTVAALLRGLMRREDVLARYGGDEFAVILPETGLEGARVCAEKLREKVATSELVFDGTRLDITLSAGVALLAHAVGGEPVEVLLARADERLLLAKQRGRNRVVSSG